MIGSPALFAYICLPPPHLCLVSMLWSEGQSALCRLSGRGERSCLLWAGWQRCRESSWDTLRGGWELLRWRRLQREVGMGSKGKTTLSLTFCSLEKACFFQTLLILVHVQLGRCTWRQIWVSAKEGFVCVLTSPHVTSNSSLPPWFADT